MANSPQTGATRVKICGITSLDDARTAALAGADFLGYILYPKSPRYVSPPTVREIVDVIRLEFSQIQHVGVFVDAPVDGVCRTLELGALDLAQLHGSEDAAFCQSIADKNVRHLKVLRLGAGAKSVNWSDFRTAEYYLCDTFDAKKAGGTGRGFDHALLPADLPRTRMFLAGGLDAENVAEAIARVRPFAVDVVSGVEKSPGRKSADKVAAFVKAAKSAGL